jgi:DNA-directed RNA polymerase subunit RPC12/RpoP
MTYYCEDCEREWVEDEVDVHGLDPMCPLCGRRIEEGSA